MESHVWPSSLRFHRLALDDTEAGLIGIAKEEPGIRIREVRRGNNDEAIFTEAVHVVVGRVWLPVRSNQFLSVALGLWVNQKDFWSVPLDDPSIADENRLE